MNFISSSWLTKIISRLLSPHSKKRNWKKLASTLRDSFTENEIGCSLLMDGLPRLNEDSLRKDLAKVVSKQFGVTPELMSPIPYFTKQDVWKVVFSSPEDLNAVVGKEFKLRGTYTIQFIDLPFSATSIGSSKSRKRKQPDEDSIASPPPKAAKTEKNGKSEKSEKSEKKEPSEKGDKAEHGKKTKKEYQSDESKEPEPKPNKKSRRNSTSEVNGPRGQLGVDSDRAIDTVPEYAVERIVSSRPSVGGRHEYLLELKRAPNDNGPEQIKLWFFDPNLVAQVSAPSPDSSSSSSSSSSVPVDPIDPSKLSPAELEAKIEASQSDLPEIEEVVGAKVIDHQLCIYVKWRGQGLASFLPATTVSKLAPQKLIKFYEANLQFAEPKL